jgi:hypothetical protein
MGSDDFSFIHRKFVDFPDSGAPACVTDKGGLRRRQIH